MSSAAARQVAAVSPASQPVFFPDEILEEIFLRLDAAADVARASAACTTFRRVVSERRFRRRFRSLHPPPILGILEPNAPGVFRPFKPPHGSAPAARAFAQAADFTFSFIDTPRSWQVSDARDGRVLLYRRAKTAAAFPGLMVCDPLHRRYIQLPAIPDAATASEGHQDFDPFLDPATDDDEDESFRVICAVQCRLKLVTFHFSSVAGKWRAFTFNRRRPLDLTLRFPGRFVRHYAHGCFYWMYPCVESLFILDPREMKLSVVDHRPNYKAHAILELEVQAVVELGNGSLGLVSIVDGDTLELYSKTLRNNGVDTEVWQHDKMIPLPKMEMHCDWNIKDAAEGYLLLQAIPRDYEHILLNENRALETHWFTLDLKTFLFVRLCMTTMTICMYVQLYAGFPPPLSLPSV
ncbi:hypothetical protein BS78_08G143700 [Paspalum vaginatum]|nr:hypothetical protein BS78_08G143700 [Paspalum vaginatum]